MKKILSIAAILCIGFAAGAQTVSSTATQTTNLNLSNAIELTFTGSGTATGTAVAIPFTTVSDYANGVQSSAQQLKVRSNKSYAVTVKSNTTNFTYTGSASPVPVMPIASVLDLKLSANATGGTVGASYSTTAFNDITTTATTLLTNCTYGGNQLFSVTYQASPGFAYPAGTYSADIVYTATQL